MKETATTYRALVTRAMPGVTRLSPTLGSTNEQEPQTRRDTKNAGRSSREENPYAMLRRTLRNAAMHIRAFQGHSGDAVRPNRQQVPDKKLGKGAGTHAGAQNLKTPSEEEVFVPGGFTQNRGRPAVTLISPFDRNPEPTLKSCARKKLYHDSMYVVDMERAQEEHFPVLPDPHRSRHLL